MFSKLREVLLVLIQSNLPPTHAPSLRCTKKHAYAPALEFDNPQELSVGPAQRYVMPLPLALRPPMAAEVFEAPLPSIPPKVQRSAPNET